MSTVTIPKHVEQMGQMAAGKEPILAATYKVLKALDLAFADCRSKSDGWQVVGSVRHMLGQQPLEQDGVSYREMREFIRAYVNEYHI